LQDGDSGTEEEEDYEVKFIVDDRYIKGKRQFKVRWVNYGPKDDTWVNEADMSCPKLISAFEEEKKAKDGDDDDEDDDAADYEARIFYSSQPTFV
jgi:Chromo (CHRromatin Organisation MOdifier) domain